ncbi:hypothetical protein [Aestuariibacter salexigens]|uniref:hypothetical protein n=1 Tax=Aestuariibacter salexigens TaxID=226010 RepID=UPI00040F35A4|nr:hypothetical protein [Aestuariibacter salexigens]
MYTTTISDIELLPIQSQIECLGEDGLEPSFERCNKLHHLLDREFAHNRINVSEYITLSMQVLSKKTYYKM